MSQLRAVIFDLYGTLVRLERSSFGRVLSRRLDIGRRVWTDYVRQVLMVTSFDDNEAFVDRVLADLAPTAPREIRDEMLALLRREVESVRPVDGAAALLRFLQRRGLRLGLISNLASPFREPLERWGLAEIFDQIAFSCDVGRIKPEARIYLDLCEGLAIAPGEALMVGDSLPNDVAAPRCYGLRSLRIGQRYAKEETSLFGVGWLDFQSEGEAWLLRPGQRVELAGKVGHLEALEPVADEDQGRYNLVVKSTLVTEAGARRPVFFKRCLLPASTYIEAFVHVLLTELGIASPPCGLLEGPEPLFWSFEVPGQRMDRAEVSMTPDLAFEVARHSAAAFLLANADLRPRNTFVVTEGRQPRLVTLDHEHCLFGLALRLDGVDNPGDPNSLDRLGSEELRRRVARRVVTPRLMRRVLRLFFQARSAPTSHLEAFRQGWLEVHQRAQQVRENLLGILRERIYTEPFLVIGTRAYRRAMAEIDVEDMRRRIELNPTEAVTAACGLEAGVWK